MTDLFSLEKKEEKVKREEVEEEKKKKEERKEVLKKIVGEEELFSVYPQLREFKEKVKTESLFLPKEWQSEKGRVKKEELTAYFEEGNKRFFFKLQTGKTVLQLKVEVSNFPSAFDGALTINKSQFLKLLSLYPKESQETLDFVEVQYALELIISKLIKEKFEKVFLICQKFGVKEIYQFPK